MNYPIKTNKLEVVFNYEKIDERYDIFEIKTSENIETIIGKEEEDQCEQLEKCQNVMKRVFY